MTTTLSRSSSARTRVRLHAAACALALAIGGAAAGAGAHEPDHGAWVDMRSKNTRPPTYPMEAARAGASGTAVVHVEVDAAGNVVDVSVDTSSGHAMLDAAAVKAARGWTYGPALQDGQAAPGVVRIPVQFGD